MKLPRRRQFTQVGRYVAEWSRGSRRVKSKHGEQLCDGNILESRMERSFRDETMALARQGALVYVNHRIWGLVPSILKPLICHVQPSTAVS